MIHNINSQDRENLILALQESFSNGTGLPDMKKEDNLSVYDASTGTLYCNETKTYHAEKDIEKAAAYFKKSYDILTAESQNQKDRNKSVDAHQKALYCIIAHDAICRYKGEKEKSKRG